MLMRHSWIGIVALSCLLGACGDHSGSHVTVIDSNVGGLSNGSIHLGNGDVSV